MSAADASAQAEPSAGAPAHRYKMKDLCDATGLPRQAIHFYIQQGLLPPGKKTGRNMAWYSDEHLERLHLIKRLQHEQFLPLKAIKAVLDGREDGFTPEQHHFLLGVKERLGAEVVPKGGHEKPTVAAADLVDRYELDLDEIERAVDIGVLGGRRDDDGQLHIAEDDVWMVETFSEMRRIGFTRELGFTVDDLAFYDEAMNTLFRREVELLSSRLSHLSPDHVARMIERGLPLIHQFLTRYHADRVSRAPSGVTSSRPRPAWRSSAGSCSAASCRTCARSVCSATASCRTTAASVSTSGWRAPPRPS